MRLQKGGCSWREGSWREAPRGGETGGCKISHLGTSLQPSESQFLHLENGGEDTYFTEYMKSKWGKICKAPN